MSSSAWLPIFACLALFAFSILCAAKLLLAPFSVRVRESVRRYVALHLIAAGLLVAYLAFPYLIYSWPPVSVERSRQRKKVAAIVQTNGGWAAFQLEAARLIAYSRTNQQHQWLPRYAKGRPEFALPRDFPLLTALNAQEVDVRPYTSHSDNHALFLKVYGTHSTGGRGIPYYGLLYAPAPLTSPDEPIGLERLARELIVPTVYELHL
jgi:hypothetical protein